MIPTKISSRWLGLGLSLFSIIVWGTSPIALSIALQVIDVYTVSWFSLLTSFGILAIYLALRQQLPQIKNLRLLPFITLITVDVVSFFMPNIISPEQITTLGMIGAILVVIGSMAIALGQKKLFADVELNG